MFMEERKIPIDTKIFCNGKYELEDKSNPGKPKIHRCWKQEGHGEVDLHDAIMKSCNVYFYDMISLILSNPIINSRNSIE